MPQFNVAIRFGFQVERSAWEQVEAADEHEALRMVRDKHEAIAAQVPGSWNFEVTNDDVTEVES